MTTPVEQQQERIEVGLVAFLTRHSLDDDYEARAVSRGHGTRRFGVGAVVALVALALLVTTAAVQTSRSAASNAQDRAALIRQIGVRQSVIADQAQTVRDLQQEIGRLKAHAGEGSTVSQGGAARLRILTGADAVIGPGLQVTVADAPHATQPQQHVLDSDLQRLAAALFEAGAEAVSINGHRLTNLTAIRTAGGAILVDYQPLGQPYVVSAVGDPHTLASRFAQTTFGAAWFDLQRQYGLRLDLRTMDQIRLPAADRLSVAYARRLQTRTRRSS